jgi:hypothetical protein
VVHVVSSAGSIYTNNKAMGIRVKSKAFEYSFLFFLFSMMLTLTTGLYLKFMLSAWNYRNFSDITKNLITLVEDNYNSYNLSRYGLMNLFRRINSANPQLTSDLVSKPDVRDIFIPAESVQFFTSGQTPPASEDRVDNILLNRAFTENSPVTFGRNDINNRYFLSTILPINSETGSYILNSLDFQELLRPLFKTTLLDGSNKIGLQIISDHNNTTEIVFASDNYPSEHPNQKRIKPANKFSYPVYFGQTKLNITFVELKNSATGILSSNIVYTVLLIGTIVSISIFCVTYLGLTLYEKKSE